MEKKFVSFIAYLHNASSEIDGFLEKLMPVIEKGFEQYEIIFVDDACTDDSVDKIREYARAKSDSSVISILKMGFYQGMESAMNAGRDAAIGDFVYEFDDLLVDYEPELITGLFKKSAEGYDIVAAGRKGSMRLSSKLFYSIYNSTNRGNRKIGPETFRIVSRRAINRVKSMGQFIPYRKAVYANCGLNMTSVSYDSTGSGKDCKKGLFSERGALAFDSFIYFTNVLEKISTFISGLFLLVTIAIAIWIVADYFNMNKPVEGWVSTMGFMALGFFGVFALLTIMLKYLSVLLNLVFKQQRYLVADIEKL